MKKLFTSKEKRLHYSAKAKDKSLTDEQRAYAKGQRDARNDYTFGFLLGKNSPLDDAAKKEIKANRKKYYDEKKNRKKSKE